MIASPPRRSSDYLARLAYPSTSALGATVTPQTFQIVPQAQLQDSREVERRNSKPSSKSVCRLPSVQFVGSGGIDVEWRSRTRQHPPHRA